MHEYKVIQLDKRYAGSQLFKWMVDFSSVHMDFNRRQNFQKIRIWCWETFGPSAELDLVWGIYTGHDPFEATDRWSWRTENSELRIYFKSNAELSMFKLQWS
jgi:hypothetical protein